MLQMGTAFELIVVLIFVYAIIVEIKSKKK